MNHKAIQIIEFQNPDFVKNHIIGLYNFWDLNHIFLICNNVIRLIENVFTII